jgi:hypothetical protein
MHHKARRSTSISTQTSSKIFDKIRELIEEVDPVGDQDILLCCLEQCERVRFIPRILAPALCDAPEVVLPNAAGPTSQRDWGEVLTSVAVRAISLREGKQRPPAAKPPPIPPAQQPTLFE